MATPAFAGSIFAWTYTTDLLPKGKWEIEHWTTARLQKENGTYNAVDFREEFEFGVTENFQAALYLNHHYVRANNNFPVEDPSNPGQRLPGQYETGGEDVHPGHDKSTPYQSQNFGSISTEFIYRFSCQPTRTCCMSSVPKRTRNAMPAAPWTFSHIA
jgi:hypothetical protein